MQTAAAIIVLTLPATWLLIGGAIYRPRRDGRLAPPLIRAVGYDVTAILVGIAAIGFVTSPGSAGWSPSLLVGAATGALGGVVLWGLFSRRRPPSLAGSVRRHPRRFVVQGALTSLTSVAEELAWRGVALGTAVAVWGWSEPVAVAVTAVLFGLLHIGLGGLGPVVTHTVTGAVLGTAFVVTGSLVLPIAMHVTYNLVVIAHRLASRTPQPNPDEPVAELLTS